MKLNFSLSLLSFWLQTKEKTDQSGDRYEADQFFKS